MYFCEKRELNCLKIQILQRLIYIMLMDSDNLMPFRKGVWGLTFRQFCLQRVLQLLAGMIFHCPALDWQRW